MEKLLTVYHGSSQIVETPTFGEGRKAINKASGETLYRLTKTLGCAIEDLIEK